LKSTEKSTSSHRREASQQLSSQPAKQECIESSKDTDKALIELQRICYDPDTKPQSEEQVSVLQLVYKLSLKISLVIVLPTSSSKSALFFLVAAMAIQQTVIVIVLFVALVDDIVVQGQAAGLQCKE
jgi:hypothetical protein